MSARPRLLRHVAAAAAALSLVAALAADVFLAQLSRSDTMPNRLSPGQANIPGLSVTGMAASATDRLQPPPEARDYSNVDVSRRWMRATASAFGNSPSISEKEVPCSDPGP